MPRILSRHDLLPQPKQYHYGYHHGYSYNGSSVSRSRSTTTHSPTISTVNSVDTKSKLTSCSRHYEGLSYRIDERESPQWNHSGCDMPDRTADSDNCTWGYFVDFTSPATGRNEQKWDASGGNEALGRVTASIPESTKNMVGSIFKREHFRGPTVFFGFGEERAFYVEKIPSLLLDRLKHNFMFFYLNYLVITAILFCVMLLTSPTAIIGLVILIGVWFWLVRATQEGSIRINASISIPQKTAVLIMGGITVFVLIYILKGIFWWTLFWSGLLIVTHALLRDASMHKDMDDAVAMEGDFTISGHHDEATSSSPFLEKV